VSATLCASIGCFTGLLLTLLMRSAGIRAVILDASLGAAGALLAAWFIAPISESPSTSDSVNIAAIVAAMLGGFVLVAISKVVRGR